MRRVISITAVFVFVMWILPLGVFVVPSQEKAFCDGQRAICLCSHITKSKDASAVKTIAKGNAVTPKESSGFSSSHYEGSFTSLNIRNTKANRPLVRESSLYDLLVSCPVEHIPKV